MCPNLVEVKRDTQVQELKKWRLNAPLEKSYFESFGKATQSLTAK